MENDFTMSGACQSKEKKGVEAQCSKITEDKSTLTQPSTCTCIPGWYISIHWVFSKKGHFPVWQFQSFSHYDKREG